MIKLFRKVRRNLLSEGRMGKYFKYAFGEIILVVLGILIALQINNWNQRRSDKAKFVSLLHELAINLTKEVDESKLVLETYFKKDSLINLNLAGKLDEKDIQAICPGCPRLLLLNYKKIPINKIAYEHIKSIIDRIPSEYEVLINEIKQLYEIDAQLVLDQQSSIEKQVNEFKKSLVSSREWFRQIPYSQLSSDAVDYFLKDPIYKNHLMDFSNSSRNYWKYLNGFRARALYVLDLILQIGEAELKEVLLDEAHLIKPQKDLEITGKYSIPEFGDHEFRIYSEGIRYYTEMFSEGEIELVPRHDSLFYYSTRFIKFKFSKMSEEPLSLISSDGRIIKCEKVE